VSCREKVTVRSSSGCIAILGKLTDVKTSLLALAFVLLPIFVFLLFSLFQSLQNVFRLLIILVVMHLQTIRQHEVIHAWESNVLEEPIVRLIFRRNFSAASRILVLWCGRHIARSTVQLVVGGGFWILDGWRLMVLFMSSCLLSGDGVYERNIYSTKVGH
jgi:hypothetical protein